MSFDSLDDLTNDIDIDHLPLSSSTNTSITTNNKQQKEQKEDINLDDLLDEATNSFFENENEQNTSNNTSISTSNNNSNNNNNKSSSISPSKGGVVSNYDDLFDLDSNLNNFVQLEEKRNIETIISGIPIHLRKKWTDILVADLTVPQESLGRSHTYSSWEHDSNTIVIDKVLRDLVMKASSKCELEANEVQEIENVLINDTENKKNYIKYLIESHKNAILSDCNYNPSKYPHLESMLKNL